MLAFDATCIFLSKIKGLYALHEQTEKTTSDGSKSFTKAATPFVGEVFEDVQVGNIIKTSQGFFYKMTGFLTM